MARLAWTVGTDARADRAPEHGFVHQSAAIVSRFIKSQRRSDAVQLHGGFTREAAHKCFTAYLRMER